MAKLFNKLGKGDLVPQVERSAQPDTTKVQMADWTILAKIDGARTLEEIISEAPMVEEDAVASLVRLKDLGMITVPRPSSSSDSTPAAISDSSIRKARASTGSVRAPKKTPKVKKTSVRIPYPTNWPIPIDQFIFDPMELDQEVELGLEKRRQVLYYHYHLKRVSYYDLFQVLPSADARDVRKAYFKLSKEFHPDLFFRKDMGSFQRRIEEIFQWVSKAYAIMGDPRKRRQYDAMIARGLLGPWQLVEAGGAATPPPKKAPVSRPRPSNSQRQNTKPGVQRANVLQAAKQAEKKGQWERALVLYMSQIKTAFDPEIAHSAARCLWELDRDLVEAESLCRRAVAQTKEKTRKADMSVTLAKVLESTQRSAEARELYAEILTLDPTHPVARMQLERLSRVT